MLPCRYGLLDCSGTKQPQPQITLLLKHLEALIYHNRKPLVKGGTINHQAQQTQPQLMDRYDTVHHISVLATAICACHHSWLTKKHMVGHRR